MKRGGEAVTVVCDMAELSSVRRAATEIVALNLPLTALVNNAGINTPHPSKNSLGWDLQWATNHIGPFVLTELLLPHLPAGSNVVFVASAVEDPKRGPAKMSGFRGARYISAEASSRGEWLPEGSTNAGFDAYATSKQATLVTCLSFAREFPQIHINAVEPGFSPASNLGRDHPWILQVIAKYVIGPLGPLLPYGSTPKLAGKMIAGVVENKGGRTGIYFDEKGRDMKASEQASKTDFQDRVVRETRELLKLVEY